jgi:Tfp pilus assembly protein FimT
VDPVIDMQLLNDALMTVAVVVGLAVLATLAIVAAAALTQRHARRRGIREIERLLAALADRRDSPAAR